MDFLYTVFHFIVAIGLLVFIHEFGHFWVARKTGVKVLRFSIGFGKVIWSYKKTADSTEYVLSAIPLGGYVKMLDEREGEVSKEDLPFSFNQQSLLARSAIVVAGPIFNLLLAVFLLWAVFILGQTGMRPVVGDIELASIAADAGFSKGDEILSVNGENSPTWSEAMNLLFTSALQGDQKIKVLVKTQDEVERHYLLELTEKDIESPDSLYKRLGLKPWSPILQPVIGKVVDNLPAKLAGLQAGDLIISADEEIINNWMQWVEYVRSRPGISIKLIIERDGLRIPMTLMPETVETEDQSFGRIGAAVDIPEDLLESLKVTYTLGPFEALTSALDKTWFYSTSTLKMISKMLIGKASTDSLSGPIGIAQYAGQSAEMGLVHFLKFMALVSVSLGVLNLLPIPVLDGGHLMFFLVEAIKGSPVSEKVQLLFQNTGLLILMSLMIFSVFLDIERLFQ